MPSGRRFTWVPPQRDPGESTRHYVAGLAGRMRGLKMAADRTTDRDQRKAFLNRYGVCAKLKDAAMLEDIR